MRAIKFQFTIRQMLEIIVWLSIAISLLIWTAANANPMPLGARRTGWLNGTEIFGFILIHLTGVASLGAAFGVIPSKRVLCAFLAAAVWFLSHYFLFS